MSSVIVKLINNDRCAHASSKTMKVEVALTVGQLHEKFIKFNTLLEEGMVKGEFYGLYRDGKLLAADATLQSLGIQNSDKFMSSLLPDSSLHLAVAANAIDVMERLNRASFFLELDSERRNLLHALALSTTETPDEEVLKFLLKKKVPAYTLDNKGHSALMYAIKSHKLKMVAIILKYSPESFSVLDSNKRLPLHDLCLLTVNDSEEKHLIIQEAIKQAPHHLPDKNGEYPVHEAARHGDVRIVSIFLEEGGVDVDFRNSKKQTLLFIAAEKKNAPLIAYLLKVKKANPFLSNSAGALPLDWALKYGSEDMLKHLALPPSMEVTNSLFQGTNSTDVASFKAILSKAIANLTPKNLTVKDEAYVAPLKGKPVGLGYIPPPPLSLDQSENRHSFKRNLTAKTIAGIEERRKDLVNNCLILCAFRGKCELVKYIQTEYHRDISPKFRLDGCWSLCAALISNFSFGKMYSELLAKALEIGFTQSFRFQKKRTLFHLAILNGNFLAIQLLSSKGESIGTFDEYGYNELHLCVMSGQVQFLRYLLSLGCDPFMSSINGETPLMMAGRMKRKDMEAVLNHHLGNPVEEIDGLSFKPKPNFVTVTIVKSQSFVKTATSVTIRPYCKVTHKLCGKQKFAKSPEVVRTLGAHSKHSNPNNFEGCGEELEKLFALRGETNLPLLMLEFCQGGNLKMVRYIAEKKGINPISVRGTKKNLKAVNPHKQPSPNIENENDEEIFICKIESAEPQMDVQRKKSGGISIIGVGHRHGGIAKRNPSGPNLTYTNANPLSTSQPISRTSSPSSPRAGGPPPRKDNTQPLLLHSRSTSPGFRQLKKPPRRKNTSEDHTPGSPSVTLPAISPLPPPPGIPNKPPPPGCRFPSPTPSPIQSIPAPISSSGGSPPFNSSPSLSNSSSSRAASPRPSSPHSPAHSSLLPPTFAAVGMSPPFSSPSKGSLVTPDETRHRKKPVRVSSEREFIRPDKMEPVPPRLEKTGGFNYGRRSLTAKELDIDKELGKKRTQSPSKFMPSREPMDFGVDETPLSVAKVWGHQHIVNYLVERREKESFYSSDAISGDEHAVQNLIFNPTRKPIPFTPNLEIEWSFSADFVIKKGNEIYREMEIQLLSASPDLPDEVHEQLGRCLVVLDFATSRRRSYILTLQNQHGVTGEIEVQLRFQEKDSDKVAKCEDEYIPIDPMEPIRRIKRAAGKKRIGIARKALGGVPMFPILIVPGLASSALEAFDTEEKEWLRERVWIDPFKIGKLAVMEKVHQRVFGKRGESLKPNDLEKRRERKHHKKEKKKKEEEVLETPSAEALQGEAERRRKWITHMTLANDGYSDPPGIKVRAVPGLHGIDFLAQVSVAKAQSYVFSHVIRALIDFGYDYCTLDACSYDWRLPPDKLQERDNYFGMMMRKIEAMSEHQGRRVVMLAHSMGNRVVQYFFRWVQMKRSKDWIDRNIHAFLAMGAPFLGSSKALRTVLCGDAMGLEVFLTKEEALLMARVSSSLPWLFPVNESAYPDDIIRVHSERNSELPYNPQHFTEVLHQYVPRSLGFYETFYQQDPLYLFKEEGEGGVLPVLEPPPVPRVWIINGINRETEVGYYMRGGKALMLDPSADKYSRQKKAGINPRGLLIREGIAYESSDTFQPSIKLNKSGDGTVPFASLNYAETGWANQIHVYTKEIEDAEHREMLASDAILNEIIGFVSGKTDQEAEEKELSSKALSYLLG